ncbi:MgtC/SapB family protein [Marinicauda algicola]|uniref:Protein MgtC n=1 Tax=Marinicauda algicola TaxID=2029849 RepID=A0A4S2H0J2_9PROT|nr:MgtC/SapB family protein [Marinicauda algicola]TGY88602.1 MgtC/SapB family protein [Marinicauda algicola]
MLETLFQPGPTDSYVAGAFRLVLAALAGAAIGFEREDPKRHAGLRTDMLVGLASCLVTMGALHIAAFIDLAGENARADPIRVVEAVTAGVAFIAAGSIIRSGTDIHGVTTAAALWLAGAVGISIGAGYFALPLTAVAIALFILTVLKKVEEKMLDKHDE